MASRLDIANAALIHLGSFPLEFATPADAAAFGDRGVADPEDIGQQRIAAIYPQVRNTFLNAHPWSWLSETHVPQAAPWPMDEEVGAPAPALREMWPHRYRLTYPWVGSVRAVWIMGQEHRPDQFEWAIEGGFFLSRKEISLIKDQRQTSEESWPQLAVTAMTLALAAQLVMPVLYDQEAERSYMRKAELALNDAMRVDAQSQPSASVQHFELLEGRFSGTFGSRADRYRA